MEGGWKRTSIGRVGSGRRLDPEIDWKVGVGSGRLLEGVGVGSGGRLDPDVNWKGVGSGRRLDLDVNWKGVGSGVRLEADVG